MHLHLVQFQLLNRQKIRAERYHGRLFRGLSGRKLLSRDTVRRATTTSRTPISRSAATRRSRHFSGPWRPPEPGEDGWKDTIRGFPGEVTRLVVRWAPLDVPVHAVAPGSIYIRSILPSDPAMSGTAISSTMRTTT